MDQIDQVLHRQLAVLVDEWREQGYPSEYPSLSVILRYAGNADGVTPPYLRGAQLCALETYWYIRIKFGTPHILDLYRQVSGGELGDLIGMLGIDDKLFRRANYKWDRLLQIIEHDDEVVREFQLETLREAISLDYPSYILALAMGAGKTVLIGAIVASEFALAANYPDGPFIQNALVFAPGKAIIESLRELAKIPYELILPSRLHKLFHTRVRLVFTRDGEKYIPVVLGSRFNIVVTNTEKIRIQKESVRRSQIGRLRFSKDQLRAHEEIANARLQMIGSLPALGIFSDEAHHMYGQALGKELKKVRKTVDYLNEKTDVVCVVNTTGTPYFQKQPLREVVVWYGLAAGINDGILKRVSHNIEMYDYDDTQTDQFVTLVVEDFFQRYGDVKLPDGAPAKLAIYFPQTDDLTEMRPVIEAKLAELGYPPSICLTNTTKSSAEEKAAFNRLNNPGSLHRVILLVNIGTEGWNCPSLFACALARELRTSNNFVLQAASRCLREVPGNTAMAKIYLSRRNFKILDRELKQTYGETINEIRSLYSKPRSRIIEVKKPQTPPLVIRRVKQTFVRKKGMAAKFTLWRPPETQGAVIQRTKALLSDLSSQERALLPVGITEELEVSASNLDLYAASIELVAVYRVDYWRVHDQLEGLYPDRRVPEHHMPLLAKQIEEQTCRYDVRKEIEEQAIALIKLQGFNSAEKDDGNVQYTAEIKYPVGRESLLLALVQTQSYNPDLFGFHYDPYLFDSAPEKHYFENVLRYLGEKPGNVADVFYTGGLTDPRKTDFYVEYKGEDGRWHRYTPDFIIRRKDGRHLIVEIKSERFRSEVEEDLQHFAQGDDAKHAEGRKAVAVRKWENLNSKRIKYEMIFVPESEVTSVHMRRSMKFMEEST